MKQYGQTINLRNDPGVIEQYVAYHGAVWPEVERGLKAIGIIRMLIWIHGRQLFMFMETGDDFEPARDFARYEAGDERVRQWQRLMESMQEPLPGAPPGQWWTEMKLVYRL